MSGMELLDRIFGDNDLDSLSVNEIVQDLKEVQAMVHGAGHKRPFLTQRLGKIWQENKIIIKCPHNDCGQVFELDLSDL